VVGVVSLLAGELIAFATFFTGQWALSAQHLDVALARPGALRSVLAAGFYLAVMALWVPGISSMPLTSRVALSASRPDDRRSCACDSSFS